MSKSTKNATPVNDAAKSEATEIKDAQRSNQIFPDISETTRTHGNVEIGKIGTVEGASIPVAAVEATPGTVTPTATDYFGAAPLSASAAPVEKADHADLVPGELMEFAVPTLKVKRVHPDAQIPRYATAGAGCFDLHALFEEHDPEFRSVVTNRPKVFRTGLAFEVPAGYVMLAFSRSGHGFNNDVRLANCVGVIDSDYRGEVLVKLTADTVSAHLPVKPGDRIAQALLLPAYQYPIEEVAELSETVRGEGGFGSTGA